VPDELKKSLKEFVQFALKLKGDEKSEAQSFLNEFFRALGHEGAIQAGATFEFRVAKKPGSPQLELITGNGAPLPRTKGGKKFADLLWPDRVLIEMKSRGENLEKHYDQTFDYWTHIVPKRPPFVILCNFDEFWIYDFNTQLFDPVDRVKLAEVPENISSFNFLLPIWKKPIFGYNWVDVTRRAADQMAESFKEIVARGEDREKAQRFILQLLVALVAEDIGLLPAQMVSDLLRECAEGASSYDLIGGLFRQMASRDKAGGGRFVEVQYFNGGLFEVVDAIELKRPEAYRLCESAVENWAHVRPEIFGTLFQDSMDKKERHAFGAHFTSEFDIRKVVGPTIVRPWRERIDAAGKNVADLRNALVDLRKFRVLDPACGSGNFLFIAYREMKRLERDILVRLKKLHAADDPTSTVSLQQFFGIDIIPFAVELAKVTLSLAKELELIEAAKIGESEGLFVHEHPLPLDNLDKNIICADALFTDWPKADAIIGNPPYLGAHNIQIEHGAEYVKQLRKTFPSVPGRADFVSYFFHKTHDQLAEAGRAGLVGTQNIRSNYSRVGSLDHIVGNGGTITDAVAAQVWSGEAAVHVSIVNWVKGDDPKPPYHLSVQRGNMVDSPWDRYVLLRIGPSLSPAQDATNAVVLKTNQTPQRVFRGQEPGSRGFVLSDADRDALLVDPTSAEVIFPHLVGRDLVTGDATPKRWIIDFGERDRFQAGSHGSAFRHVETTVLSKMERIRKGEQSKKRFERARLNKWWLFRRPCVDTVTAIKSLSRYIVCSRVTKRPIFEFMSPIVRPDSSLQVFVFEDDYSFGILQSGIHWAWFNATCSKLKGDFRYTPESVFDTFPWPQKPTRAQIKAAAEAAVALRALRRETMRKLTYSLRDLYRTLEQPGDNPLREAHARLDAAVRAAYGMKEDVDPLGFLLELNLACAKKEKAGEKITPPGLPLPPNEQKNLVTDDCIEPPTI